jgi:hypothetical protein
VFIEPMAIKRYKSLEAKLEDFFETEFDDLPDDICKLLTEDDSQGNAFFGERWGDLLPAERRQVARKWDYTHDPANQEEIENLSEINKEIFDLTFEIEDLEEIINTDTRGLTPDKQWEAKLVQPESKKQLKAKRGELQKLERTRKRLFFTDREPIQEGEDGQDRDVVKADSEIDDEASIDQSESKNSDDGKTEIESLLEHAYEPRSLSSVAKLFPLDRNDSEANLTQWKKLAARARRNGLDATRVRTNLGKKESDFNIYLVAKWLLDNKQIRWGLLARRLKTELRPEMVHLGVYLSSEQEDFDF